jgi:hypothetical protein
MEYTAEDLIAHKLTRSKILIAKPKFDQEGADLLALLEVKDGAKFCRIQCKGRSLLDSSKRTSVTVPQDYVTDGFILLLFIEMGEWEETTQLFCFLGDEIRSKWHLNNKKYRLTVTKNKLEKELKEFRFNSQRIQQIEIVIRNVDVKTEFNKMVYGKLNVVLDSITTSGAAVDMTKS